jgi:hypothetical protein
MLRFAMLGRRLRRGESGDVEDGISRRDSRWRCDVGHSKVSRSSRCPDMRMLWMLKCLLAWDLIARNIDVTLHGGRGSKRGLVVWIAVVVDLGLDLLVRGG